MSYEKFLKKVRRLTKIAVVLHQRITEWLYNELMQKTSSFHTSSFGRIRVNFLGFDRLPAGFPVLSVMVFLLHVGRLPLAISRIVSRNRILCEAAFRESMLSEGMDSHILWKIMTPATVQLFTRHMCCCGWVIIASATTWWLVWTSDYYNGNGLLFHMTQPTNRSIIKAIACSKPTISEH